MAIYHLTNIEDIKIKDHIKDNNINPTRKKEADQILVITTREGSIYNINRNKFNSHNPPSNKEASRTLLLQLLLEHNNNNSNNNSPLHFRLQS